MCACVAVRQSDKLTSSPRNVRQAALNKIPPATNSITDNHTIHFAAKNKILHCGECSWLSCALNNGQIDGYAYGQSLTVYHGTTS